MRDTTRRTLVAAAIVLLAATAPSPAADRRGAAAPLAERHQRWLEEVALILTGEERKAFLALVEEYRRDAFVEAFWKARDPDPATPDNPFRETYYRRRAEAEAEYGSTDVDQARTWILNGEPGEVFATECSLALWPVEIWYYGATTVVPHPFLLLFVQPAAGGPFRLWTTDEGIAALQAFPTADDPLREPEEKAHAFGQGFAGLGYEEFFRYLRVLCPITEEAERVIAAVRYLDGAGRADVDRAAIPARSDPEWLATFADRSTDLAAPRQPAPLSAAHQRWLEEVALLITAAERRAFVALAEDHQREGFIEAFWKARDPDPATAVNELRSTFEARRERAVERFGSAAVDQARVTILNGDPAQVYATDCDQFLWPIEIWHYPYGSQVRRPFVLLFVQPPPGVGPFRLWHPSEGWRALQRFPTGDDTGGTSSEESYAAFFRRLVGGGREPGWCPMQAGPIIDAIRRLLGPDWFASEVAATPPPPDPEWLETFHAFTTELAGGVAPLDAELAVDFPGRHQSRTRVRGTLAVPASREPSAWVLTGEVLREAALFEAFRYRFEMPPSPAEQDSLPLVFERALRPGTFQLVLKLEEVGGRRATRLVRDLEVPLVDSAPAAATAPKSAPEGPPSLRLPPPAGDLQTGTVRITAECDDPRVARVAFTLDGAPLFTRSRPPWTVELQLGSLPRAARIRALGYDRDGALLAADELLLNAAPHRFAVRLLEPREGLPSGALRVRAEVQVPEGKAIERLELFLDERRVATLWQPPWTHTLALPPAPPTYVRALAVLADGSTAEDVVLLGEEGRQSRVDVDLVELYVSAANARGRPVHDLAADELEVREEGVPQELRRFQHVTELPLHVALLVDTSASMAEELPAVQSAGLTFFRGTLRPEDRAAVLTFSEEPRLACRFTDDPIRLATALAGLSAERSTRLWDSLAFALHYFQGVPGKRALLVFSDGADRGSGFSFEQVMELAQHAGVAVYAVSFGTAAAQLLEGRRRLARVADATGGRSFVLGTAEQLAATYAAIEEDLRSQYLVAYQSSNSGEGLRRVEVAVRRPGHTARTVHGYVP